VSLTHIPLVLRSLRYGLLQRACFCLAGVGMQIGFGRASPASMMRAGAEQYLKDREREGWEGGGGGGDFSKKQGKRCD
jgi:hypothetical protein